MKIALVGIGKIARDQHIPSLAASPDWELCAAVSRNRAVENVPTYPDLDAMLARHPEIGTVSLCLPPVPRFDYASKAIRSGRHVMLEKPPGATLSEVEALRAQAERAGVTLYATWHSRRAAQVPAARAWLADARLRRLAITWKEDVRKWHPGQAWIWEAGGLGVFDPGINALSIATEILPVPVHLTGAVLHFPKNRETPIAADLRFAHPDGADMTAEFQWDHSGIDIWTIEAETDKGRLVLENGGATMSIDGVAQSAAKDGLDGEYPRLYADMARLVRTGVSEVDLSPLRHVADAFLLGKRESVNAFTW